MLAGSTQFSERLSNAARDALRTNATGEWRRLLKSPVSDGFSTVLSAEFRDRLFEGSGMSFNDWIQGIRRWVERVQDPRQVLSVEASLLHDAWGDFELKLGTSLRRARGRGAIPQFGGVLAYIAGLSKCLVIRYGFAGTQPSLVPVAVIDDPKTAFDVWPAIDQADAPARNALKTILASGHKLLFHRDVLCHVDRRLEPLVFGPSIDTLIMSEILARDVYEATALTSEDQPKSVIEVGCGSGFLAAGALHHLPGLSEIYGVDLEFEAVACTEKNLRIALDDPRSAQRATIRLITGPFDHTLLNRQFDIVLCNPPYIPIPPEHTLGSAGYPDHLAAVGGLELLSSIIGASVNLLTPGGRMLVMTSSLCLQQALDAVPKGITVTRPFGDRGYEVLFDVEAVLDRTEWLSYLTASGALTERDRAYYHSLHPLWLIRE
jgi:methylase of polypeptide subunit release factors